MGPGRDFLCSVCGQENPQKAVLCTENTNKQMKVLHLFSRKTQKTDAPPFCGHVRRLCLFYSAADSSSEVVLSSSSPFTGLFCAMTSFASRTFWISLMRTEPVG